MNFFKSCDDSFNHPIVTISCIIVGSCLGAAALLYCATSLICECIEGCKKSLGPNTEKIGINDAENIDTTKEYGSPYSDYI
jgi:hypothetical protein